ncbi:MAG: DNA-directed RNA polymerase subunit D [Candidatus Aenigmarchaeota archaeon]|nr:DNA-directed RNA polymerase subunit D [Candidatus Aenigmarchaeota archaeon]
MKVKMLEKKDNKVKLEITGTTPAFTNMIRRTILQHVNIPAIDSIDVIKNTSSVYNESLAHRIGLVPLTYKSGMSTKEDCKCKNKGCTMCEVKMVLAKKGPATVYAKDIKSTDKDLKPSNGDAIIIKLYENQEINLEATAVIKTGADHANWQPAVIGYQYFPTLKISKDAKNIKDIVKACPHDLIDEKTLKLKDPYKCDLCNQCIEAADDGAVTIETDNTRHILTIESISGVDPKTLMLEALKETSEKLKELEASLK